MVFRYKFFLFLSLLSVGLFAQQSPTTITQTVKGRVIDKQSKYPISGATVVIIDVNPQKAVFTDAEGEFKITEVPLGRFTIKIVILGYQEQTIPNVLVTAGKEVVLNIELEELILVTEEVVIIAEKDKSKPNNDNAVVSTRSFTIDETSRYAGSRNDPSRMAMNFAGVGSSSDARNDIVIRGNSPLGLLWRLDGIDIPSPNHFGSFGTTGGPVSILNNNVLANSDFMTGAFPAQYGNAISGVFDLQMRRGNREKREYMIQMGFNGLEAGVEGPFSKKSKASYLANYRYSTLGIFKALGISFGTSALPEYQDLSFKVEMPTEKAGKFSVFGIGGISHINILAEDVDTTDLFSNPGENTLFKTKMGVAGLSHLYFFNNSTYSKTVFSVSGTSMTVDNEVQSKDSLGKFFGSFNPNYIANMNQVKYSLNYSVNKKFSAKNTLTTGMILDRYDFTMIDSFYHKASARFVTLRNFVGVSYFGQVYSIWQHRFNDKFTLNTGLHAQHFFFNNTSAIEPRVGLKYQFTPKQSFSAGYGLHSQLQTFQAYFREDTTLTGSSVRTNKNLDFVKSHQAILGYDYSFSKHFRLKTEIYYQYLYNVAVERNSSSFSMINSGADFVVETRDSLINNGTGRNYGLEITLEKFYHKNYYFLATASLFDSKYKGSDGILRNTAFNNKYVFNMLGGKEFKIKTKNGLAFDLKMTWAGGKWVTPIDINQSNLEGAEVKIEPRAYDTKLRDYFRTDFKITYRLNGKKASQEWALDIQNIFNTKNDFIQRYNPNQQAIVTVPQLGIFPVFQYRLTF